MINDNIKETIKENKKKIREKSFNINMLNSMSQKIKINIEGKKKKLT